MPAAKLASPLSNHAAVVVMAAPPKRQEAALAKARRCDPPLPPPTVGRAGISDEPKDPDEVNPPVMCISFINHLARISRDEG